MVSEEKKKLVKHIADLVKEFPIIGVVNMSSLPAPQLQKMRESLRDSVNIIMTRKTLLARGLEAAGKENVKDLIQYFKGMPALLFTKENPFTLYKTLEKNKSSAPAKGGQEAPKDVIVKAGPTSFAPGPVIGELGSIGIKCGVEGGKIAIKEDSVVVKEGEVINAKVAEILKRLGVEPMEIGLNLVAVWEKGSIFKGSDLHIDEEEFMNNLTQASQWAVNLSIEAGIPTAETIELMVIKAFRDAKAVALEGNVLADAVLEEVLGKVGGEALALKAEAKVETAAKPVEEKKEEPKAEPEKPKEELKEEEKEPVPEVKEKEKPVEKEIPPETVPEPPAEEKKEEPTEEKKEEEKKEETPKEVREEDYVPNEIKIEKPDLEKEHVEEIKEIAPEQKEIDTSKVELSEEEKKEADEEAKEDVKEMEVKEIKNRVEEIKERIEDLKEKATKVPPSVQEMVKKTKEFAEKGKGPSAADLLEEAEEKKPEAEKEKDIPSAHDLLEKLKKKGTLRGDKVNDVPSAHELAKRKK